MSLIRPLFGLPEKRDASLDRWKRFVDGPEELSLSGLPIVDADSAKTVSAFYACVKKIAETISTLPCYLMEEKPDGSCVKATDHYLYWLMQKGLNPRQTQSSFLKTLHLSSAIRGNDYAEIVHNARGEVIRVIPLHPDQVQVRLRNDRLIYWVRPLYGVGETRVLFEENVMHFRLLSEDGLMSLSPVEYAKNNLELALAQGLFAKKLFTNAVKPSGVLETDLQLDDESRKIISESWKAGNAGLSNAHGTPLLDNGIKWKQVSLTAEDAQFLESRKFQNIEICRWFSMPPHLIGELDRSTNNNIEQQAKEFLTQCIRPWLVEREQTFGKYLLTSREQQRYYFRFDTEELERGDRKTEWETANIGIQGGILNQDEARERLGYNPNPDGSGKIFRVPLNMEPAGQTKDKNNSQRDVSEKIDRLTNVVEKLCDDRQKSVETPSVPLQNSVRNLSEGLLFDVFERILQKEILAIREKSLKLKARDFELWIERFYEEHRDYSIKQLTPLYKRVLEGVGIISDDLNELALSRAKNAAGEHCGRSRRSIASCLREVESKRADGEALNWNDFTSELFTTLEQWRARAQECAGVEMESIEALLEV